MDKSGSFDYLFYINMEKTNQSFFPVACSEEDFYRTEKVAFDVLNYRKRYKSVKEKVDLNLLLSKGLYGLYNMGCIINMDDTVSLLNGLEYCLDSSDSSLFATISELDSTKAGVAKRAKYIVVPEMINSSSPIFMSHEIAHVLKERNPKECKFVYTIQEVVPMLIELIIAFLKVDSYTFRNLVDERLALLSLEAKNYYEANNKMMNADDVKIKALQTSMQMSAVYLNSFYYSIILFQMYLSYPSLIKELISAVLNLEITSQEMIEIALKVRNAKSVDEDYNQGMSLIKSHV